MSINNISMLPRFRGSCFQSENGWQWEILISFLGDGDDGIVIKSNTFFKTKNDGISDLKKAIQLAIQEIKMIIPEINENEYIDMKTNDRRKWDSSNEH